MAAAVRASRDLPRRTAAAVAGAAVSAALRALRAPAAEPAAQPAAADGDGVSPGTASAAKAARRRLRRARLRAAATDGKGMDVDAKNQAEAGAAADLAAALPDLSTPASAAPAAPLADPPLSVAEELDDFWADDPRGATLSLDASLSTGKVPGSAVAASGSAQSSRSVTWQVLKHDRVQVMLNGHVCHGLVLAPGDDVSRVADVVVAVEARRKRRNAGGKMEAEMVQVPWGSLLPPGPSSWFDEFVETLGVS